MQAQQAAAGDLRWLSEGIRVVKVFVCVVGHVNVSTLGCTQETTNGAVRGQQAAAGLFGFFA